MQPRVHFAEAIVGKSCAAHQTLPSPFEPCRVQAQPFLRCPSLRPLAASPTQFTTDSSHEDSGMRWLIWRQQDPPPPPARNASPSSF